MPHRTLINRIRAEFLEMPGLRLTLSQTQRLCGGERDDCETALRTLVDEEFLCLRHGHYARSTDLRSVAHEARNRRQHAHSSTR